MMPLKELAEHLYRARWPVGDPLHDDYSENSKEGWLRVATAAAELLRGPRKGEELYAALNGNRSDAISWADAEEARKARYCAVAATFSTPPESVGWPEGLQGCTGCQSTTGADEIPRSDRWYTSIVETRGTAFVTLATVYGATREEVEHLARLAAWALASQRPAMSSAPTGPCPDGWAEGWTIASPGLRWRTTTDTTSFLPDTEDGRYASHVLAGWRPSSSPGVSKQVYKDLKRDHAALLVANQQQRQDLIEANACLTMARFERDEAKERDSLRARAESCHGALLAAKAELAAFKDGAIEAQNSAATWALERAASVLASHLTPPVCDLLSDTLIVHVEDGTLTPRELFTALRSPPALAALLLRVRAPAKSEGGGA